MAVTPGPVTSLHATAVTPTTVTLAWVAATQLVVTPGGASFRDNAGNVWAITAHGDVTENNRLIPGGGGTSALTYVSANNQVFGQDANSKIWYLWDGANWRQTTGTPVKTLVGAVYSVSYKIHTATTWTAYPTTTTGTTLQVVGLKPSTLYDMEVITTGGH